MLSAAAFVLTPTFSQQGPKELKTGLLKTGQGVLFLIQSFLSLVNLGDYFLPGLLFHHW